MTTAYLHLRTWCRSCPGSRPQSCPPHGGLPQRHAYYIRSQQWLVCRTSSKGLPPLPGGASPKASRLRRVRENLSYRRSPIAASAAGARGGISAWLLGLSKRDTGVLLLNLLSAIYGTTAVVIKLQEGASADDPATGTCLLFCMRSLVALVSYLPLLAIKTPANRTMSTKSKRDLVLGGIETGFWMFLEEAGQALGLETSTASHAAVLLTFSVILVPFLESFTGRPITRPVWAATLVAALGMILLEEGPAVFSSLTSPANMHLPCGDLLCLASSLGFALYIVRSERQCSQHNPIDLAWVQLATVAAASVGWELWALYHSSISGASFMQHMLHLPWLTVLFVGGLGTGVAQWMELEALRSVTSTTATLIFTTSPIWSAVVAYFVLGEALDVWSGLGGSLILLSSMAAQLLGAPKEVGVDSAIGVPVDFTEGEGEAIASKAALVPVRVSPAPRLRRQQARVQLEHRALLGGLRGWRAQRRR